jgi:Carboxypeptidase regulatory-like domain/TonB dependent receptor-like, beta-barrel
MQRFRDAASFYSFCVLLLDFPVCVSQYPGRSTLKQLRLWSLARFRRARNRTRPAANRDDCPHRCLVRIGTLMSYRGTTALCFISFTLLLALGLNAAGQTANLSGVVKDASQAVVVGAKISISKESTGLKQMTLSGARGYYLFAFLLPGRYTITVEASGFGALSRSGVKLDPGQEARLDFTLMPAEAKEFVTVQGSSSSLQTESSALGTEIDPQLVQNLPLNGRTFQLLIALAPGVVWAGTLNPFTGYQAGIFVNGQRDTSNYFTVDGVSANVGIGSNPFFVGGAAGGTSPAATVLGTTHNLVSIDGLQEFKVQTSTYSAENGRAGGGQVQIVTRSGSNDFHGELFDYLRNEAFDANDWFANSNGAPRSPFRHNDFGGALGGPIIKGRTFFYFSYEGLRLVQPSEGEINVPSFSAREAATGAVQDLLNAFPKPNGPEDPLSMLATFTGNLAAHASSDNTSIRIDQVVNQKLVVFGRYSEAPSELDVSGLGIGRAVASFRSATLGATLLVSPRATSDFRLNYSRNEAGGFTLPAMTDGAVPPPDSVMFPAPFNSSNSLFFALGLGDPYEVGRMADNLQRQGNLVSNTSIARGSHELRFGLDYRYLAPHYGAFNYRQRVRFGGVPGALSGMATLAQISSFSPVTVVFQDLSLYGQDTWKITPRLTLTYGLRWELNPAPYAKGDEQLVTLTGFPDLASLQIASPGTPLYNTTYGNFAPRIGVAYQLFQHPGREIVVRGGFGIYYDLGVGNIGDAALAFPHMLSRTTRGNLTYPLSSDVTAPPPPLSLDPPYSSATFNVFAPDHQLPRSYQWNFTIDQRFGATQVFSLSYVGDAGRRLLRENVVTDPNPRFVDQSQINLTTNGSFSNYNALQAQFQRRMARGLAALLSYTWSHSIDDTSADAGFDNFNDPRIDRGASDFDVRHAFSAALTYDLPGPVENRALRALLGDWSVDSILVARTALPVNVYIDPGDPPFPGLPPQMRPDQVPGVPFYIPSPTLPGGMQINPAAFAVPPEPRQGNLVRNSVRGFSFTQLDFDFRRQFALTERIKLQWRVDFFNLLNHPNFGLLDGLFGAYGPPFQPNPTFGTAFFTAAQFADVAPLFSPGGARSIQLSLRLIF